MTPTTPFVHPNPESFRGQRLTAHGGLCVWSQFLQQQQFRRQLEQTLAHAPINPNAFAAADIALGLLGGILAGAEKLSRGVCAALAARRLHAGPGLLGVVARKPVLSPRRNGHQEGVAVGYTRHGLKPCHRPLLAAVAEEKLVVHYWLRSGDAACGNGAAEFLRQTASRLPSHIRIGLVRAMAVLARPAFRRRRRRWDWSLSSQRD